MPNQFVSFLEAHQSFVRYANISTAAAVDSNFLRTFFSVNTLPGRVLGLRSTTDPLFQIEKVGYETCAIYFAAVVIVAISSFLTVFVLLFGNFRSSTK